MKHISALAFAASIIGSEAINLQKRTDGPSRVIQHDIQRRQVENPIQRDRLRRRQTNTIMETLDNEETLYFANVTMGTPAQSLRLHIDTGSSDLWVNVANSSLCSGAQNPCAEAGVYSPDDSSTYEFINDLFNISYVDGSGSSGDYAKDVLRIGGATLEGQEFGIGYTSSSEEGIIGIGYTSNEALLEVANQVPYVNVPKHMLQSGLINTNAYSLWLNDLEASTGSILFGGVNTGKYTGSLETVPILTEGGIYAEFIIALTGVGYNGNAGSISNNVNTAALLDSGSSLMYLPNDIAQSIFDLTGAKYDSQAGAAIIDCSMANNDTTIDFTFSSPTIRVALSELVILAGYEGRREICILGIAPADGTTPVLGDTFLRSAYVVYDLTGNTISLAQTNFDSTSDNIMEITNSSIPDATYVSSAVTSVSAETGGGRLGGLPAVTSTGGASIATGSAMGYGAMAAAAGAGVLFAL